MPQALIQQGKLSEALAALQAQVRKDAANPKLRIFLFQLLCVLGQWPRALTQLHVVAELDPAAMPMVQTYREAIQCEGLRTDIFAGKRMPLIFGEPPPWIAQLLDALKFDGSDPERATTIRAAAMETAPASSGRIDDVAFSWITDADPRIGPVIEAIVNGKYFWIPIYRIRKIEMDPPTDLRDAVWTAATFTWTNGATTVGLIPTRYVDTTTGGDDAMMLARRTEWPEAGPFAGRGMGQRMLAIESADYALLDIRVIEFDAVAEESETLPIGDTLYG
jgi:type VI secretion system protein ImpE